MHFQGAFQNVWCDASRQYLAASRQSFAMEHRCKSLGVASDHWRCRDTNLFITSSQKPCGVGLMARQFILAAVLALFCGAAFALPAAGTLKVILYDSTPEA